MPKIFDRGVFYDYARRAPFGNRLSQQQIDGMNEILDAWEAQFSRFDIRFLAYILATAFHETGGKMIPVREGFAKTDAAARKIVAKYKYGKPDPHTGEVYYGRGLVQLTWVQNYLAMGRLLNLDLVTDPDLALEPSVSVWILIEGMLQGKSGRGDFTGHSLEKYFNKTTDDPVGARRIINGTDKASLIAGYHQAFLDSLTAAKATEDSPVPVSEGPAVKADGPSLFMDKTMLGAMTAGGGGIVTTIIGAVSNPYALGAFTLVAVVIGIGLYLVVTGRVEIKKKAGA